MEPPNDYRALHTLGAPHPLWVISRHNGPLKSCPFCAQKYQKHASVATNVGLVRTVFAHVLITERVGK